MKLLEATDLYNLISRGSENVAARNEAREIRKIALESASGLKKVAFDTRRIDQETEYNPRRGLQYYNRSEPFVSEAMGEKLANFSKLHDLLARIPTASCCGRNCALECLWCILSHLFCTSCRFFSKTGNMLI